MLTVCELFKSIQGESTFAGEVCSFVRLAGCNLSCSYCDTEYAKRGGTQMTADDIIAWVEENHCRLVEITGGEPLLQNEVVSLAARLCDDTYKVLVETNGSLDISSLPDSCVKIVDVKCPGSGMEPSFFMPNLNAITHNDECKFVISDKGDFDWACDFVLRHRLTNRCTVLFSPNSAKLEPKDLAEWIVQKNPGVRLGLQLHKFIWSNERGK
jgi:7-carboxy-7-deazaguanine synthase